MRLLFVTPEYLPDSGGGIITFYKFLLPELVRQGHEVEVMVADARHIGEASRVIDGVQVRYLEAAAHGRWLDQFARYTVVFPWLKEHLALAWAAWEAAKHGAGWDHVEVTEWPLTFVPWVLNRHLAPCTVQLHGSHGQIALGEGTGVPAFDDEWVRLIESALLKEATAVQTNSQLNGRLWEERLGRPISVESPAFRVNHAPPFGSGSLARPLIGRVFGRFNVGKGAFALAKALSGSAGSKVTIEWFGNEGALGDTTVTAALLKGFPATMDAALRHFPQIPHDAVLAKLTDGAFVLIPTLSDVFNLTLAEAMAMRAIVVCSKYAGASELIENGVNGFVYDPLDAADLDRILEELSALSPDQVRAITESGARTVTEKLDPTASAARRVKFYAEVAATRVAGPVSDWMAQAVSGAATHNNPGALLDRCGLSELTSALLRRAPGFFAKR